MQESKSVSPQAIKVDKEKALKMAKHFKSNDVNKQGFWVKYNANYLRSLLSDETITEVKFIAAAYLDDGPNKNNPTVLIQLKRLMSLTTTYEYIDAPADVCPPPDGVCDTDSSIEN